jgi:hypothetical protein
MFKAIKRWYEGEAKMTEGIYGNGLTLAPMPYTEYHWTARLARSFVQFYLDHWKWLWGAAITLLGIYVAYLSIPAN